VSKFETTLKVVRPGAVVHTGAHRAKVGRCRLHVQLGSGAIKERRMWVADLKHSALAHQHAASWIDAELNAIIRSVDEQLQQQATSAASATTASDI